MFNKPKTMKAVFEQAVKQSQEIEKNQEELRKEIEENKKCDDAKHLRILEENEAQYARKCALTKSRSIENSKELSKARKAVSNISKMFGITEE
jgi:hypothetical protein